MREVVRYLELYWLFLKQRLKILMEYRASFLIGATSTIAQQSAGLLSVAVATASGAGSLPPSIMYPATTTMRAAATPAASCTGLFPREGGFFYTETELAVMLEDAAAFAENGAQGVVFGFLHDERVAANHDNVTYAQFLCGFHL